MVYLRQTWNFRSHAVSACISLWHHRLMHACIAHDITGLCMQLLHGLYCFNFISDIPYSSYFVFTFRMLKWHLHLACCPLATWLIRKLSYCLRKKYNNALFSSFWPPVFGVGDQPAPAAVPGPNDGRDGSRTAVTFLVVGDWLQLRPWQPGNLCHRLRHNKLHGRP